DRSLGGREAAGHENQQKRSLQLGARGAYGNVAASARLTKELADLIAFKISVLPATGYHRRYRWKPVTARAAVLNFGLLFGALVSAPLSDARGIGVPVQDLTFALLAFPAVWDWYLHWRERRRGFLTISERSILYDAKGHLRERTGWIRQHPEFARRLRPIPDLVSEADIIKAQKDWAATCD